MSTTTRPLIALAAMLLTVCMAHAAPQYAGGADQMPSENLSVRQRNPPHYPEAAVKARHEGTVVLMLLISPQREILERKVETSSGWPELDQAALDASEHWAGGFNPGTKNGQPVAGYARVPITFGLPPRSK
jgi:periplasmic protein TonB